MILQGKESSETTNQKVRTLDMEIRVLGAEEMSQALEMKSLIEEMKTAFLELSSGRAKMPLRTRINLPEQEACLLYKSDAADE